jgi:hypothetical protein
MHDGTFLPAIAGVHLATITDIGPDGRAQVMIPELDPANLLWARSLVATPKAAIGREVAIAMLGQAEPLVLGLIQPLMPEITADGEKLVFEANREVTLKCGKASITLTADGRVTIRGTQVLSRADGPNRIQGGSVQLN